VANALLARHKLAQVHVLFVAQVRLQLHRSAQRLDSLLTRGRTPKLSQRQAERLRRLGATRGVSCRHNKSEEALQLKV
jgi:hypothetical protein